MFRAAVSEAPSELGRTLAGMLMAASPMALPATMAAAAREALDICVAMRNRHYSDTEILCFFLSTISADNIGNPILALRDGTCPGPTLLSHALRFGEMGS